MDLIVSAILAHTDSTLVSLQCRMALIYPLQALESIEPRQLCSRNLPSMLVF